MSSENEVQRAILFADVIDSSRLYQKLGDERAQSLISEGISLMRDIVEQYSGVFIKSIGDEVLAEYESPAQAVESAIFMIRMLRNMAANDDEVWNNLHIKVGIHYGSVVEKNNDVFGNTVNLAARIVSKAKDSQILVTEAVIDHLDIELQTRFVEVAELKGIKESVNIHEILPPAEGEVSGHTSVLSDDIFEEFQTMKSDAPATLSITIHFHNKKLTVGSDNDRIKIGRNPDNDLVLDHDGISRYHCKIEFKKGKFYLDDESANGSFIVFATGEKKQVRRDRIELSANCEIGLGQPPQSNSASSFSVKF